jgi:polar amino acid transport system substrate-binding protein
MNKKLILILTSALTVFLIIGAVSAGSMFDFFSGGDSNTTNDNETFIVGFSQVFPPFGYKASNGEYTGFDYDLAKEVAKRNNWTFKPTPIIDWNTKEVELNSNAIDCIWSEFTIDGRENDYSWSKPYFNNSQVVIVKSNSNITSLSDLNGKVVEAQISSSSLDTINENKTLKDSFADLNEINDYELGFMDLDSGVCDALVVDSGFAKYHIAEKYSNDTFKIIGHPLKYEKYGVAFKKGNDELKDQVQKTLDEMFKDGTVDRIAQNYSDYGIPEGLIHP